MWFVPSLPLCVSVSAHPSVLHRDRVYFAYKCAFRFLNHSPFTSSHENLTDHSKLFLSFTCDQVEICVGGYFYTVTKKATEDYNLKKKGILLAENMMSLHLRWSISSIPPFWWLWLTAHSVRVQVPFIIRILPQINEIRSHNIELPNF